VTVAVSKPAPFTAQGAPLLSARKQLDVITAYREVGTYRGAAQMCGLTHKTVKRVIERDVAAARRVERRRNYESVRSLVAAKVEDIKARISAQTTGRRGRATDPVWANRRKLMRGRERLSQQAFTTMWNALADGDVSNQIVITWIAKEELRALLATATRGGVRHDVAHHLTRFYAWCAGPGRSTPELARLAGTIQTWWPEIHAFLTTGVTNAGTEGTNRLNKDTARTAFGFRNLDNQRRRVRFACTRRQRLGAARG